MPLSRYDGVIKYGVAYGKACDNVANVIMYYAKLNNIDATTWSDDYRRNLCLHYWNKMIVENENKELFYQGQKL